jgi:hypothetical protein
MRARTAELARSWRRTTPMRVSGDPADVESVTIRYLMYVLLPAWFVPGIADYWMHRRSFLESLPFRRSRRCCACTGIRWPASGRVGPEPARGGSGCGGGACPAATWPACSARSPP